MMQYLHYYYQMLLPENVPYIWGSRILMIVIGALLILLVKKAWANHSPNDGELSN